MIPVSPTSAEPLLAQSGAAEYLRCEILPVTLHAGEIMYVQRGQDAMAWYESYAVGAHPSDIVRVSVEAFFGAVLDPSASVVHSTAWRYECGGAAGGRLILTYLVVLPPIGCTSRLPAAGQFMLHPIGDATVARAGTVAPPDRVALPHVLAHALDHLSLLIETDLVIARALGPQWRAALDQRQRRPAGELRLRHAWPS